MKNHVEREIIKDVKDSLLAKLRKSLEELQFNPSKWIQKPVFTKNTISLGSDDGQVYNINYDNHDKVQVNLSFRSRKQLPCFLETPDRFFTMIKRGFKPFRGTLTKENGRKLILTIPFGKKEEVNQESDNVTVAGLDLGVKTFGVLSIAPLIKDNDGSVQSVGAEIKNYFIDQKQLQGSRDAWLKKGTSKSPPFNYKRRLTNLQALCYGLQSKMDRYKQAHPKNYRNKIKFYKLRKEFKRVWKKIQNLHIDIARQVATRVVAACQHHGVSILNVEDLSWSKPGKKQEVGYFLKTWQVHWFHGRIQEILISRARQEGIIVRKVNARNTSKRCSRCNEIGIRTGKKFMCTHCGLKLDSDLNAARNICQASFPRSYMERRRDLVPSQVIS